MHPFRPLVPLVLLLVVAILLPAVAAEARGKKRGKKHIKARHDAVQVLEQPRHDMFKHIDTKPFFGHLQVQRWVLEGNDLKVLLVSDPSAETVSYHTYFNVGSSDEVEGKTGLAHLFEHMMFKRTSSYDDTHFSQSLEEAGAPDLNAWTWLDMTAYHVSLPAEKLGLIIDLEATRMDGLLIDKEQLDAEREVVINERRYRVDNDPEGAMNERLWALAFEKTRYHWPTIGWQKDIENYSVEDCTNFYRDWYAPNNATVVVVGKFDTHEALSLIEQGYKDIPASNVERLPHGEEPEQTEARRIDMELDLQTEMLQLGYKAPAVTHPDYAALAMLDGILTAGNSSRLERRLVDTGLAASAGAWLPTFQQGSLYEFSATMRQGRAADAALAVIRAELADLRDNKVTDEELERVRNQLLVGLHSGLLSNSGRAGFIGFNEVASGSWEAGLERIEAIRKVGVADVQRVAREWFIDARSSLVVGRPKGKDLLSFEASDLPAAGAGELADLPPIIGRPPEGPPAQAAGSLAERESMGWTRMLVYDPTLPIVWFQVVIPFGSGVEPEDKAGLANVTSELLLRGTTARSRDVFERSLEGLGASVSAGVSADHITLSGSVLSKNWPDLAALLVESLEQPAFAAAELQHLVEEIQADLVEERNNDRALVRRFFERGLYEGHPYGRPVLGTTESLNAISRDDVLDFYNTWFTSQQAILALMGDFDAGVSSDLAGLAGKLGGSPRPVPIAPPPDEPTGRSLWLIDKPGRTQVQLLLGHLFGRPEGAGYAAAWLANEAFGGYGFSARLMMEVREKRGWSYGAYGSIAHSPQLSSYSIWVFPATSDALPCLELVLKLYEEFAAEGLSTEELSYARSSIVNGAAFYADTPSKRLGYEVRRKLSGYDPMSLIPLVREATLEQVNAAAASAYHPGALFGVMVGTAEGEIPVAEGADPQTLLQALQASLGAENVTVLPFDSE
jgi:zinc protease